MPGFDINPAAGTQVLGDPNSGDIVTLKKVKGKRRLQPQDAYVAPDKPANGGSSTSSGSSKKNPGKKKPPKKEPPAPYNPLYSPFKTPADLRKDAAELAALGVGSEDALRATAAQQQAGLSGLTSALTGTLTGIADRAQAGLAGFGNLYTNLANTAQSAGQSAAVAAGAPTSVAPGASATVASNLANLAAPTMGYAPAAAVTGAQMVGAVTANLTKALMDRSSKLSADTAKYLYQLQNDEVQRAISQGTMAQNEARLNLSGNQEAWNQKMDVANYGLKQQSLALQQQKIAQSIINADSKGKKSQQQKIQGAKDRILNNISKWTMIDDPNATTYDVRYYDTLGTIQTVPVQAGSETEARAKWEAALPADQRAVLSSKFQSATAGKAGTRKATQQEIISLVLPILVNKGMNRKNAIAWIITNIVPTQSSGGTFMGGVGGSGV